MPTDDPREGAGTEDPHVLLDLAHEVVEAAPEDPDSWLMLGYAQEALAWGLDPLARWPLAPWVQFHPKVEALEQMGTGDPDWVFPYDEGTFKALELIDRWGVPHGGRRGSSSGSRTLPNLYKAHETFLGRLDTPYHAPELGLTVRADPVLRSKALSGTRHALLEQAFDSYLEASERDPSLAHCDAFRPAVRRFKQVAYFEVGDAAADFPPSTLYLGDIPGTVPTDSFDLDGLLRNLSQQAECTLDAAILEVETLVEPSTPGFILDRWQGDVDGPGSTLGEVGAAPFAETLWGSIQRTLNQLDRGPKGALMSLEVPPEANDAFRPARSWEALPLPQLAMEAYKSAHRRRNRGRQILDLLFIYANAEENPGDIIAVTSLLQQIEWAVQQTIRKESGGTYSLEAYWESGLAEKLGRAARATGLPDDIVLGFTRT